MKKFIKTILVVFLSVGLSGCIKSPILKMEDKLIGSWVFEKVSFREKIFSKRQDKTEEFKNLIYQFFENGKFVAINLSSGTEYEGVWELGELVSTTDGNRMYTLQIAQMIDGQPATLQWQIDRITHKKLRASEWRGNEHWDYKLIPY